MPLAETTPSTMLVVEAGASDYPVHDPNYQKQKIQTGSAPFPAVNLPSRFRQQALISA